MNREVKFQCIMRGGKEFQIMIDDLGYTYCNALSLKNGNVRWRCSKKCNKERCKASVVTKGHFLIRENIKHNHAIPTDNLPNV